MASPLSSPITTTAGAGSLIGAIFDIAFYAFTTHAVSPNIVADIQAIIAGAGLIAAKDFNVTSLFPPAPTGSRYDPATGKFL